MGRVVEVRKRVVSKVVSMVVVMNNDVLSSLRFFFALRAILKFRASHENRRSAN